MLLDGFGDSEHLAEAGGNSELLFRLIHAGSSFHSLDPTDTSGLPKLNVDEWSSSEDMSKAHATATQQLNDKSEEARLKGGNSTEAAMDIEFGGKVDETLSGHASFTLSLLERLCFVLSDSGLLDHLPESLGAIADAKALHAETFALKDRITKLNAEIVEVKGKLHVCEQQKNSADKTSDRTLLEHSRQAANGTTGSSITSSSSASGEGGVMGGDGSLSSSQGAAVTSVEGTKELLQKMATLEKQLGESESSKAKAEMTLTERLARPLSQTEAQVRL